MTIKLVDCEHNIFKSRSYIACKRAQRLGIRPPARPKPRPPVLVIDNERGIRRMWRV